MSVNSTGVPLFAGVEDIDDMFMATMEEMIKLKTDRNNIYYLVAYEYKKQKEYAKSNKILIDRFPSLTPDENELRASFKVLEGINHYYLKDKAKAVAALEKAKSLDDTNKDAVNWLDYVNKEE